MLNQDASQSTTIRSWRILSVLIMLVLATALTMGVAYAEATPVERSESIDLREGDWLSVSSNRESLQSIEITGNLSAVQLPSALRYPADTFNMTSYAQGQYSITMTFSFPSEYNVVILANASNAARKEIASYYFSSGQLLLTINLNFSAHDPGIAGTHSTEWGDFASWTTRFGAAFPLWVKLQFQIVRSYRVQRMLSRRSEDGCGMQL